MSHNQNQYDGIELNNYLCCSMSDWIRMTYLFLLLFCFMLNNSYSQNKDIPYGNHYQQILDIYPSEKANSPIIIIVHGGAFSRGSKDQGKWKKIAKFYQEEGFAVVNINYRLDIIPDYPGFPTQQKDLSCAIVWAKENATLLNGDSSRVALFGHSAGAYIISIFAMNRYSELLDGCSHRASLEVDAVILSAGAYNFKSDFEGTINFRLKEAFKDMLVDSAMFWEEAHPINHINKRMNTSFLILHGRRDTVVDHRQSTLLFNSLRDYGHSARIRKYAGIGHELANKPDESPIFPEIIDYLYELWGLTPPKGRAPEFQVYPNPLRNQLSLYSWEAISDTLSIRLMDIRGRIINDFGTQIWEGPNSTITLGDIYIPQGLYFLQIRSARRAYQTVLKVVKQ